MNRQLGTRRIILGALLVMLAILAAVGDGRIVSAEIKKTPDFGSKENFKVQCELMGGTFIEDPYGNLECHWPGGRGFTECDSQGNDCWHDPGRFQQVDTRGGIAPGSVADDPTVSSGSRFNDVLAPSGNQSAAPAP